MNGNLVRNSLILLKISCISFAINLTSCKAPQFPNYHPSIDLKKALFTINKRIEVKEFIDLRKIGKESTGIGFYSRSMTNSLDSNKILSTEITDEIIEDFATNFVFSQIDRNLSNPDFVLVGEILDFHTVNDLTTYAKVSAITIGGVMTFLFGFPTERERIRIELRLKMYTPQGKLVGTYIGKSESISRRSMYRLIKFHRDFPMKTNLSLSQSVSSIRDQLLADIEKYDDAK